jgi:hypothetical protein
MVSSTARKTSIPALMMKNTLPTMVMRTIVCTCESIDTCSTKPVRNVRQPSTHHALMGAYRRPI